MIAIAEAPGHCNGVTKVFAVFSTDLEGRRKAHADLVRSGRSFAAYWIDGAKVGDVVHLHQYRPIDRDWLLHGEG